MKVLVIGKTEVDLFPFQGSSRHHMPGKAEGSKFEKRERQAGNFSVGHNDGQSLIEFAGRLCYESFDLPNEKTATNAKYIANIIQQQHFSVLEHVNVTFYAEGVSRNLSHELIRHRHLSFSELSQRFVNMETANVIVPPALQEPRAPRKLRLSKAHKDVYRAVVDRLTGEGKSRKQAREAARYGLPAGTETKLVVTGNLRAWRDFLAKRWSAHADQEMQQFADRVYEELISLYPDVFDDVDYQEV